MSERDVEQARWLALLGAREVHRHWQQQRSTPLPDALAALRGLFALAEAGELRRGAARAIVVGAWALLAPRPTQAVPVELWRALFSITGPCIDEEEWTPPESLTLFRGCADEQGARAGMSWTVEPAVARCHAEGRTGSSEGAHTLPRIFTTQAPRAALLARIDTNGEAEIVVDPAQLGEVTEIEPEHWRAEFPEPITVWLDDVQCAVVPNCRPWSTRYRRASWDAVW
ncbi:hypothetical protein [Petropleomorpha daqingensis]|uniref:Uncharacterized protein n=1 Tax=Petropleomorpha daqingensis TaxID=2026353 RepID=A0A853CJZ5_9ACTN|nr:hypothetical protein [Petropleomorpha daqingensis]NYJ06588.1 hypothetical protein [Petropleomorpha daqingensis]